MASASARSSAFRRVKPVVDRRQRTNRSLDQRMDNRAWLLVLPGLLALAVSFGCTRASVPIDAAQGTLVPIQEESVGEATTAAIDPITDDYAVVWIAAGEALIVRESAGIPLRKIARQAKMSHGHLSKVERGEPGRPITPAVLVAYENATGFKLTGVAGHSSDVDHDGWRRGHLSDARCARCEGARRAALDVAGTNPAVAGDLRLRTRCPGRPGARLAHRPPAPVRHRRTGRTRPTALAWPVAQPDNSQLHRGGQGVGRVGPDLRR